MSGPSGTAEGPQPVAGLERDRLSQGDSVPGATLRRQHRVPQDSIWPAKSRGIETCGGLALRKPFYVAGPRRLLMARGDGIPGSAPPRTPQGLVRRKPVQLPS